MSEKNVLREIASRIGRIETELDRLRSRDYGPGKISSQRDVAITAIQPHQILRWQDSTGLWTNRYTALFTGPALTRTIATGAIDVAGSVTGTNFLIAGEGGLNDDLATITTDQAGHIIVVRRAADDVITLKDGTGNLELIGGDVVLDSDEKAAWLLYTDGGDWILVGGVGISVGAPIAAHAASHQHGGSDEVATATPAADAIPKADGTGVLADGWIPAGVTRDSEVMTIVLANDGAGSGLDADLLDGLSSAAFALASHTHAGEDIVSGTVADARIAATITRDSEVFGIVLANDGAGSGLDADLLDGLSSAAFALASHSHAGEDITSGTVADARIAATITRDSEVMTIVLANDGAGSGLDADLLDGLSSAAFALAAHTHTASQVTDFTEAAQDVIGALLVDSSTINYTYDDGANTLTTAVIPGGIDHGGLAGLSDDDHTQYLLADGTRALTGDWEAGAFDIILDNTQFFRVKDTGGSARGMVGMSAANLAQFGPQGGSLTTAIYGGTATAALSIAGVIVTIADTGRLDTDTVRARDSGGLFLTDDAGSGIFVEDGGQVGIGTITPDRLLVVSDEGASAGISAKSFGTGLVSHIALYTPRGTEASPTATQSGDQLGAIFFGGWDTNLSSGASITAIAAAEWGTAGDSTDAPADLIFATAPDGAGGLTERLAIGSDGIISVLTANTKVRFFYEGPTTRTGPAEGHLQVEVSDASNAMVFARNTNDADGIIFSLLKSRGTVAHSNTVVQDDDEIARILFWGADGVGAGSAQAAHIKVLVDGTPGSGDMPARMELYTSPDGSAAPTNGLIIYNNGWVRAGPSTVTGASPFHVYENTSAVDATAGLTIEQDGAGDAVMQYLLTGGQRWVVGIDNSDSDAFGIAATADLTNNKLVRLSTTGILDLKAGTSSGVEARVGGMMSTVTTVGANTGGGEDNVATYSVPASALANDGDSVWMKAAGSMAATAASKTIKVHFGTSGTTLILDTGAVFTTLLYEWWIEVQIFRTGAATQKATAIIHAKTAGSGVITLIGHTASLNQTLSGAVTIRITGTGTNDNDITCNWAKVGFDPANS